MVRTAAAGLVAGACLAFAACSSFQDSPVHRLGDDDDERDARAADARPDGAPPAPTCGALCEAAGATRCVLSGTSLCFARCETARQAYDGCRAEADALLACLVREPEASCAVQGVSDLEGRACDDEAAALLACVCLGGRGDAGDEPSASCGAYCAQTSELVCRDESCVDTCEAKLDPRAVGHAAEGPWVTCVAAQTAPTLECASPGEPAADARGPRPAGERCRAQHRASRACAELVGACVCDEAGCAADCAASACVGDAPDATCRACLEGTCLDGQGYFLVGEPFD